MGATSPGASGFFAARVNGWYGWMTLPSSIRVRPRSSARCEITCHPPVSRVTVPSGATSETDTASMPSPLGDEVYSRALIGPRSRSGWVSGSVWKTTPVLSLGALSDQHGRSASTACGTPAVHWLVDRVHRPETGTGGT